MVPFLECKRYLSGIAFWVCGDMTSIDKLWFGLWYNMVFHWAKTRWDARGIGRWDWSVLCTAVADHVGNLGAEHFCCGHVFLLLWLRCFIYRKVAQHI